MSNIVMTALSTDRVKCLPFVIQDKIAIEIWLNQFEDARKQLCRVKEEHSQVMARRVALARRIQLVSEHAHNLVEEMQTDPDFNVDERTSLLTKLNTSLMVMNAQYDGDFHVMGHFMMERGRLNQQAINLRQELIVIATRLGELDSVKEKIEKILLREFSEGL
uniref:Uncharacterized protein n=1 Tax=viral metagenome TaxID=1070528 RepID=A0A6C0BC74_9ZZZZ